MNEVVKFMNSDAVKTELYCVYVYLYNVCNLLVSLMIGYPFVQLFQYAFNLEVGAQQWVTTCHQ